MASSNAPAMDKVETMPALRIVEDNIGDATAVILALPSHYTSQHLPDYAIILSRRLHLDGCVEVAIMQFLRDYKPREGFTMLCRSAACLRLTE